MGACELVFALWYWLDTKANWERKEILLIWKEAFKYIAPHFCY